MTTKTKVEVVVSHSPDSKHVTHTDIHQHIDASATQALHCSSSNKHLCADANGTNNAAAQEYRVGYQDDGLASEYVAQLSPERYTRSVSKKICRASPCIERVRNVEVE
jgi:hypothetical protein